jgi:hypothetical protein
MTRDETVHGVDYVTAEEAEAAVAALVEDIVREAEMIAGDAV